MSDRPNEPDSFATGRRGAPDKFADDFQGWHGKLNWFFNLFLKRKDIVKLLPCGTETGDRDTEEKLYLRRWFIAGYGSLFSKITSKHIFLHCIKREDDDRHLHDHPWSFSSFILWGGYTEQLPWWMLLQKMNDAGEDETIGAFKRPGSHFRDVRPWRLVRNRITHTHRITKLPKGSAWTLVITSGKHRQWGFWVDDEPGKFPYWVYWRDYLAEQGYETTENIGDD